jgi:hypothetical protein
VRRALVCAFVLAACREERVAIVHEPAWLTAPGDLDVGVCADVDRARICYRGHELLRVPRVVPSADEPWRCAGQGSARVCRRARDAAGPFVCDDAACVQAWPRLPDDGEWECFERAGAVMCRGGEPPAGVVPGPGDAGWICGERSPRVCVDLAPDRPESRAFAACRYEGTSGTPRQVCVKPDEPRIGAICRDGSTCPLGAVCVDGVCAPSRRPDGSCWFDADCGQGSACPFAACVGLEERAP